MTKASKERRLKEMYARAVEKGGFLGPNVAIVYASWSEKLGEYEASLLLNRLLNEFILTANLRVGPREGLRIWDDPPQDLLLVGRTVLLVRGVSYFDPVYLARENRTDHPHRYMTQPEQHRLTQALWSSLIHYMTEPKGKRWKKLYSDAVAQVQKLSATGGWDHHHSHTISESIDRIL